MSPITHFLASWTLADAGRLRGRDLALATWCGVLPDADGFGMVIDAANRALGRPDTWYYGQYHHGLLHGVLAAIVLPLVLAFFAVHRLRMFLLGVFAMHIHFLCDVLGSRGPGADDLWPLPYLAPLSERCTIVWAGQWPLNGWPNIALTVLLLAFAFVRAVRSGYSPVSVFSTRADRVFVATVRERWRLVSGTRPVV